jgi:hypothetical protein
MPKINAEYFTSNIQKINPWVFSLYPLYFVSINTLTNHTKHNPYSRAKIAGVRISGNREVHKEARKVHLHTICRFSYLPNDEDEELRRYLYI